MTIRPLRFALSLIAVLSLVCAGMVWFELDSFHFRGDVMARMGQLDLRTTSFAQDEVIPLSGQWVFYPNRLLSPEQIQHDAGETASYRQVPRIWGQGYGTYRLRVKLNPVERRTFNAIDVPSIASAYRLWINGKQFRGAGRIGTSRSTMTAQDRPGIVALRNRPKQLDIVVEVSNFVQQKGGIGEPILLSNIDTLVRFHDLQIFVELFIAGSLFAIGLYYFSFYIGRSRDRFSLYFSILCLDVLAQAFLLNTSNLTSLFPRIGWILESKLQYLSSAILISLLVSLAAALYPKDANRVLTRLFVGLGGMFTLLIIATPPWVFTYSLGLLSLSGALVLAYTLYVFAKAVKRRRNDAWIHLISLSFFVAASVNDILYYLNVIKTGNLVPEGLYLFVLVQNLAASRKHASALSDLEKRTLELTEANNALETRIQDRTRELEQTMVQLRQSNALLQELSTHDTLTTIFNRSYFENTISELWDELQSRMGVLTILFIDIDFFKEYNDTYGHIKGDACLRQVALAIHLHVKTYQDAFAARYGGEEFVVVLPGVDRKLSAHLANSLREEVIALNIPHAASRVHSVLTISVGGVSAHATPSDTWEHVVEVADHALYQAKERGRNTTVAISEGGIAG